jgi:hypothetical protein
MDLPRRRLWRQSRESIRSRLQVKVVGDSRPQEECDIMGMGRGKRGKCKGGDVARLEVLRKTATMGGARKEKQKRK